MTPDVSHAADPNLVSFPTKYQLSRPGPVAQTEVDA